MAAVMSFGSLHCVGTLVDSANVMDTPAASVF